MNEILSKFNEYYKILRDPYIDKALNFMDSYQFDAHEMENKMKLEKLRKIGIK